MRLVTVVVTTVLISACGGSPTLTGQATLSPTTVSCGSQTSARDTDGALVGSTLDSTTIRVGAPQEIRVDLETTFQWQMTGNSTFNLYAEAPNGPVGAYGRFPRVDPSAVEVTGSDSWSVRMTFPAAGCWRLHSERAGGKLAGDVWINVLPRR
jgi:hypothetical protein